MSDVVKAGYKRTEVGVIAEDWEVASLGELGQFKIGINKGKEDFGLPGFQGEWEVKRLGEICEIGNRDDPTQQAKQPSAEVPPDRSW